MEIYKKGTKVWIWCCTHDFQSEQQYEYVLEENMSEEELNAIAEEFFWNTKEPEWGFSEEKLKSNF